MDSVVLLHLLHYLAPRFAWQLSAVHVHHGISPNADAWMNFCTELCARYGIPLHIEYVDIDPLRANHGIEAAARKLRHAVFARHQCGFVALAHHADDQAETLLLQLLRGAGVKGSAAMPVLSNAEGPLIKAATMPVPPTVRPLLDIKRGELLEYAQLHTLQWVEDESNADDRYPRNFLRHRLLPLLQQKFPAYRQTLSRSAQHFAEAGELLDELAQQDMQGLADDAALDIALLRNLSHPRGRNLLRYWLHRQGAPMPQTVELDEMLHQLLAAREDASVCVAFGAWRLRRYQGRTYAFPAQIEFDPALVVSWHDEPELYWPALSRNILFCPSRGKGISLARLQQAPVTLRLRCGGEALRPHPDAARRSLKNLLQEQHIPPWQRERLPLLYCGDELACVVGVAVAADFQATDSEPGIVVG
jgi:tRNA(Ile)-lysidine synthase